MNTKNIAIIAVVAVVVIALAAVTWHLTQDEEGAIREPGVGDDFLYKTVLVDLTNEENDGYYYYYEYIYKEDEDGLHYMNAISGEDQYSPYNPYNFEGWEPERVESVEIMGMVIDCDVFTIPYDDETWTYWNDPRTNVIVKIQSTDGYDTYTFTLIDSTVYGGEVDYDVNVQETEIETGDVMSYLTQRYTGGKLSESSMFTKAVVSVDGDSVTYSIVGTDTVETTSKSEFLHSEGYRGLEPTGSAYVKTIDYGDVICDVYKETFEDGSYDETYIGRDDGVMYLRYEYDDSGYTEYSLVYSSLVIGSGSERIEAVDDSFGYTITAVSYHMLDGVIIGSSEIDSEVYCIYEDGTILTSNYENMVYDGDVQGLPWYIEFLSIPGETVEGKTVNTPWGSLECNAVSFERNGVQYTVYIHDGIIVALLAESGELSSYTVVTYSGYDWGRDDPYPTTEFTGDITVGDWCTYIGDNKNVDILVTEVGDDGNITVLNNGVEEQWTVTGLLYGPGYENGKYLGEMSCDFSYGTRYCDLYLSVEDDGTMYTSYIGQDDSILYCLEVERNGTTEYYELFWASYII